MTWTLHRGDCRDYLRSLPEASVSAVVTDPPYSERTHKGNNAICAGGIRHIQDGADRAELQYYHWTPEVASGVIRELCRVSAGWVVVMTDHMLVRPIQAAMEDAGRYAFAPLPYVAEGSRCRLGGDGPSCWAIWLVVCRPATKDFSTWGTLPGAYIRQPGWDRPVYPGGKPVQLLRELLRDYTRPGDTVLDPYAGAGTTGVACVEMGRNVVGCEIDEAAHALAERRIAATRAKPGLVFERSKKRREVTLL